MSEFAKTSFEIVFNEISAKDISSLEISEQMDLLKEFKVNRENLENIDGEMFGKISREGKTLYRYRAKDLRIYFEVLDGKVIVHRVLHKNTFKDFLFRSSMPLSEDEELGKSKQFWELIEAGESAKN